MKPSEETSGSPLTFAATLEIIGINPFVQVPDAILEAIFHRAGKNKGAIPIRGDVNDRPYRQTLVRYKGIWRLYINLLMLPKSPKRIGETLRISIDFDPEDRSIAMPTALDEGLKSHPEAQQRFEKLSPSLQKEIVRYIARLKSTESVEANVQKAIAFLEGKGRFIGRELTEE